MQKLYMMCDILWCRDELLLILHVWSKVLSCSCSHVGQIGSHMTLDYNWEELLTTWFKVYDSYVQKVDFNPALKVKDKIGGWHTHFFFKPLPGWGLLPQGCKFSGHGLNSGLQEVQILTLFSLFWRLLAWIHTLFQAFSFMSAYIPVANFSPGWEQTRGKRVSIKD